MPGATTCITRRGCSRSTRRLWAKAFPCTWRRRSYSWSACSGRDGARGHRGEGPGAQTDGYQRGPVPCRRELTSAGTDIGFGVFLRIQKGEQRRVGEVTKVLPNQCYNTHLVPKGWSLTFFSVGVCKCWQEIAPAAAEGQEWAPRHASRSH